MGDDRVVQDAALAQAPPGCRDFPTDAPLDIADLVEQYHQAVFRYAYRLAGRAADAEDLTQQTFLIAHQKLGQVRDAAKVRSWLFAVLRSQFFKSRRKRQPMPAGPADFNLDEVPERLPAREDIDGERLQTALDQLTDEFRLVLVMFYFEECSYKEIAARLEIPLGTVMSRLSRAKEQLRRHLFAAASPAAHEGHSGNDREDGQGQDAAATHRPR